MAKVIMRYEVTFNDYLEVEVPDEVYNEVLKTKKDLEDYVNSTNPADVRWWENEWRERYDNACDKLEAYINPDAPYHEHPDVDYIYINALETEDGEELIGW